MPRTQRGSGPVSVVEVAATAIDAKLDTLVDAIDARLGPRAGARKRSQALQDEMWLFRDPKAPDDETLMAQFLGQGMPPEDALAMTCLTQFPYRSVLISEASTDVEEQFRYAENQDRRLSSRDATLFANSSDERSSTPLAAESRTAEPVPTDSLPQRDTAYGSPQPETA